MQIEIDFDVFKELTARRESEEDSYNSVIRRLLKLPVTNALASIASGSDQNLTAGVRQNALAAYASANPLTPNALSGAWFDNVHFPEATQFRATYKGQAHFAKISGGRWVGGDGVTRTSPSAAAGAISNTTVNGWRFWYCKRPTDAEWVRMDELKQ